MIRGSKPSRTGDLKGVQQTRDLFVGRCEVSASVEDINRYVQNEFNITLSKCECLSTRSLNTRSFKITVCPSDIESMLDSGRWPENVIVRKFFNRNGRAQS